MTFNDFTKQSVWNQGRIVPSCNPADWRHDRDGKAIKWGDYGDRRSKYGWEIHHLRAKSRGGSDDLANPIPLHWETNARLGKGLSRWCPVCELRLHVVGTVRGIVRRGFPAIRHARPRNKPEGVPDTHRRRRPSRPAASRAERLCGWPDQARTVIRNKSTAVRFGSAGPGAKPRYARISGPSAGSGHGSRHAQRVVACRRRPRPSLVMPGLDPGIHVRRRPSRRTVVRAERPRGWPDQVRP